MHYLRNRDREEANRKKNLLTLNDFFRLVFFFSLNFLRMQCYCCCCCFEHTLFSTLWLIEQSHSRWAWVGVCVCVCVFFSVLLVDSILLKTENELLLSVVKCEVSRCICYFSPCIQHSHGLIESEKGSKIKPNQPSNSRMIFFFRKGRKKRRNLNKWKKDVNKYKSKQSKVNETKRSAWNRPDEIEWDVLMCAIFMLGFCYCCTHLSSECIYSIWSVCLCVRLHVYLWGLKRQKTNENAHTQLHGIRYLQVKFVQSLYVDLFLGNMANANKLLHCIRHRRWLSIGS